VFAKFQNLTVAADRLSILYRDISLEQVRQHFESIVKCPPDSAALAELLPMKAVQKFDSYLSSDLLNMANSKRLLEVKGASELVSQVLTL